MAQPEHFTEVLQEYVGRVAYRPGQLAQLTGVPPRTIANWLEGRVRQPRVWQDVVRLGQALRLDSSEMDRLLAAAGYPCVEQLERCIDGEVEQDLLAVWDDGSW